MNSLPEYPTPLPDIVMTSGEIKSQDISSYTDADLDPVSILLVVPSLNLPMVGTSVLIFSPTTLTHCGMHSIKVILTDGKQNAQFTFSVEVVNRAPEYAS